MALLEVLQSHPESIVQGGLAAHHQTGKGFAQVGHVVAEGLVGRQSQLYLLVEVHHKHFILRFARLDKGERCRVDLAAPVSHTSTTVHDQPDRQRNILTVEETNVLKLPVLEDLKILLAQAWNETAFAVQHRHVQWNQLDIERKREVVFLPRASCLRLLPAQTFTEHQN